MDDKFEKKLDSIDSKLHSIDITLVKHQASLEEHMKRSDLLERGQEVLFQELKPVQEHIHKVDGILKFVGILATVGSLILAFFKLFSSI